ncbi:MAG: hypothetical protein LYZ70_05265 [Nitrososphaerales archaeon]|nr:hypothetical protein [Nitrososphaerales archaeon]
MSTLASLLELATAGGKGPSPSFTKAHFFLAFLTIGTGGTIGRQALAKQTGLGEGAVRTVLKKLRDDGYAEVNASGCHLTARGRRLHSSLRRKLSPIATLDRTQLTVGGNQAAVVVRGCARTVRSGIQQRDSAILVGAMGATTYAIKGDKFTIPGGDSDCEKEFPSPAWKALKDKLSPHSGDAVVLCGAEDSMTAKLGVLSAALTLL